MRAAEDGNEPQQYMSFSSDEVRIWQAVPNFNETDEKSRLGV